MHYCVELNFLVLFGGRNDTFGAASKSIFNDLWILRLDSLIWAKVACYGDIPERRYNFSSCLVGTQLVIFGGLNGKTYNGAALYICEMEQMKALKNILTKGKNKAYFDVSPIDKTVSKAAKKNKKEMSMLEMIRVKPVVKLTRIQELEKQLREGMHYLVTL